MAQISATRGNSRTLINPTEPSLSTFDASGCRIAYFEWGERGQTPLLLIHATGFHARVWDQTIAHLTGQYHVIAIETRGHGRSEKRGPVLDWKEPAEDVFELLQHLKLAPAIGAGLGARVVSMGRRAACEMRTRMASRM